jgi:hypothetical protein
VQTAVGLICVLLGLLHFLDRDRPQEHRSFYFGSIVARSPRTRAVLAVIEIAVGFVLLFWA